MLISEKPGMWARQWEREGRQKGLQEGRLEGLREGRLKGRLEGRQEGRTEGRQEGRMEGKVESATTILEKQLQRKFGAIPDWAALRIAQADADALQQWALNILDAEQIEDVFK